MVAVVVGIVDVDDEEGQGGGGDAQKRESNNPNLKGFLSCMHLYHIHIVRMQCFFHDACFFGIHIALFSASRSVTMHFADHSVLS